MYIACHSVQSLSQRALWTLYRLHVAEMENVGWCHQGMPPGGAALGPSHLDSHWVGMELGVFLGLGDTNMNGAEMMKSPVWSGQCSKMGLKYSH